MVAHLHRHGGTAPKRRLGLGLRARAAIGFAVTGFLVAAVLAVVTHAVTRNYLVHQQEASAEQQAFVNARLARTGLRGPDPDVRALMTSLGGGGTPSVSLVRYGGESFSSTISSSAGSLPGDLEQVVSSGHAGIQRYRDDDGNLKLAVGVPIAAADSSYFELFPLADLEQTLWLLSRSLVIGVIAAGMAAAAVGWLAAGRMVRPLAPIADAAEQIAGGDLGTRLSDIHDPDLRRLTDSFNAMAGALEDRIEREARFAADVSHELRSPLMAVTAAVAVIDRRRGQLPPEVTEAFTILSSRIQGFQQVVLDLLEISRVDSGTAALVCEVVDLRDLVPRVLARHGADEANVTVAADAPTRVEADRRRLVQAIGNVVDNAARYAGGTTAVTISADGPDRVRIALDDRGPGVLPEERDSILGRFSRGEAGLATGAGTGSGLGLSLVAEHLRLHGGSLRVEDNPGGGARFVIELPVVQP
jgi:signal transduction histidine kinase